MKKILTVFALVLAFGCIGSVTAHAATLNGWAWSETFGWISFNSSDSGAGGGPYSVSVNSAGDWSGYAWSANIGWISFNAADVSPCGAAGHLNTANGAVTGWARALVYGGTDGCIELSGTNHSSPDQNGASGVTYDAATGIFKGYAWGGDTAAHVGLGWVQFNPTANPVVCLAADCGYGGTISGTCTAVTPYQNVAPNTSVTFQANPTSGNAPYQYAWNPSGSSPTYTSSNQYTASYPASAAGPIVKIKDSNSLVTNNISCPSVSVLNPISSSNVSIGRTVASATGNNLTIRQTNPFAVVYNYTMTSDYSCSPVITSNGASTNGGYSAWDTYWRTASLSVVDNGDGTKTWSGNTGTNLKAGTVATPVTPGIYQFGVSCTSSASPTPNPAQSATATLKVNSSAQKEI